MRPLEQDLGFEMLSQSIKVKVSRFSRRIRILHWYNAGMILTLYTIGIHQFFSLNNIGFDSIPDLRVTHIQVGLFWVTGVLILGIVAQIKPANQRDVIVADKLVIKQRIFLYASTIIMILMAFTGISQYLMRPYNVPGIRSILLALHGVIAFSYLPVLSFHIYLAILQRESRQSLKTMIMDVYLKYLIHNSIPNLQCWLSDNERVIFVHGKITEISLVGFHVRMKKGKWQAKTPLNELANVEFQHADIEEPLRMAVEIVCDHQEANQDTICVEFKFQVSLQDSARILLSRALFFRALFLARRNHPRLACNYPVIVNAKDKGSLGQMVDLSHGGMGLMVPLNLNKGCKITVSIILKNPPISFEAKGKIMVKEKMSSNDWSYGLCFGKLPSKQFVQIMKLINHARISRRHRNTHYWR